MLIKYDPIGGQNECKAVPEILVHGGKYDPSASGFDGMNNATEVEAFNIYEVAPDDPQSTETADPANAD